MTAHELGHVILMAKGFLTEWKFVSPYPTHLGEDAAEEVANCFIDPLADREAIQRGFDITALDEHLWNDALDAAKENVSTVQRLSTAYQRLESLTIFCLSLSPTREPLQVTAFSDISDKYPGIVADAIGFQVHLSPTECDDPQSCFQKAKTLRNLSGFEGAIFLKNPATKQWE